MIRDPQHIFLADFGQRVVLHTKSGDREITGIYDAAFFNAELGETELDTTQKRLTCRDQDVRDLKREDTVTFPCGETLSVVRLMPDGTGMTTVLLSEVEDTDADV